MLGKSALAQTVPRAPELQLNGGPGGAAPAQKLLEFHLAAPVTRGHGADLRAQISAPTRPPLDLVHTLQVIAGRPPPPTGRANKTAATVERLNGAEEAKVRLANCRGGDSLGRRRRRPLCARRNLRSSIQVSTMGAPAHLDHF